MLEVKHLKRVYKVKNNEPVYALNDVSLKFQESGLVFILGKSGSGKSTLLNVMGGLDKADEGEIIIEGKSSKEFSGSEMDSYRNTYLGFIFQEYNILSDFTVKENIALALQLQHKKATEKAINDILEQVDLAGYGKRKPNELSGGQKQRVAIARALVKEPKIIFGDEPTGALDSNTGKQVFETLKKLSKDKLVIIVSHDRDFAEHFGDRVIELKDGKVISDITKTTVASEKHRDGVSLLGENIIRIEKGHELTADDLPLINKVLSAGQEDTFISSDVHANDAVCEAARIDKSGNREEFFTTDPDKLETGDEEFSPIKSHFSLGHAFRMGARSLKVKPFRLVMTILLSTIAFSLFGASAALSTFNKVDATKSTIVNNKLKSLYASYGERGGFGLNDERIQEIASETGAKVYKVDSSMSFSLPLASYPKSSDLFHMTQFSGGIEYTSTIESDFGYSLIDCKDNRWPSKEDEVAISLYAAYSYADLNGNASADFDYSSLIGQSIYGNKITGIFDSHLPEGFLQYRDADKELKNTDDNYSYFSTIKSVYSKNQHNVLVKGRSENAGDESYSINSAFLLSGGSSSADAAYSSDDDSCFYFDEKKTGLNENEALLSLSLLRTLGQGGQSQTIDMTFDGAYMGYDSDEGNLYKAEGIDIYSAVSGSYWVKNAALYKTVHDKYLDFYQNHKDILDEINAGTFFPNGDYANFYGEYTYDTLPDQYKYDVFSFYFGYVTGNNGGTLDTSNEYYAYYSAAIDDYQKQLLNKFTFASWNDLSNFISAIDSYARDEYFTVKEDELLAELKDDSSFISFVKDIEGVDDASSADEATLKRCLREYLTYYASSSIKEDVNGFVIKETKKRLSSIDLTKLPKECSATLITGHEEDNTPKGEEVTFSIAGIEFGGEDGRVAFYLNKERLLNIQSARYESGIYSNTSYTDTLIGFGGDEAKLDKFLKLYFQKSEYMSNTPREEIKMGSYSFTLLDSKVSTVITIASMLVILTKVFLYVGIGMAVFSALLFYNFISVSINNKKREIGILRAVGAKKIDVFKIFYSEALIIALINFLLSTIATFWISASVNSAFQKELSLSFGLMNPNIFTVLMILAVALGASILSASLPVIRLANKKPIDAIQNR